MITRSGFLKALAALPFAGRILESVGPSPSPDPTELAAAVDWYFVDAVNVDTITLPGQVAPPLAPTQRQVLGWLYKVMRNRTSQTSTQWTLYADDETTVDAKATVSNDEKWQNNVNPTYSFRYIPVSLDEIRRSYYYVPVWGGGEDT